MASMNPEQMQAATHDLDLEAAKFGHMVVSPPWLIKLQLMPIRFFETSNVRRVLDVLAAEKPAAAVAASGS